MTERARATALCIRVSADERRMLARLAVYEGLSASDVVRQAIRDEYEHRFVLMGKDYYEEEVADDHAGR